MSVIDQPQPAMSSTTSPELTTAPELTVIMTTCNREDMIAESLASLAEQRWDGDWDIIIVDNHSKDRTVDLVEEWLPSMPVDARLIRANDRQHPSYARNLAVGSSSAVNIAFVDDDDRVGPGWVSAIGNALRQHEFVASRSEYDRLNSKELAETGTFQRHRLGRHFGVEVADSAGMGIRRQHWLTLGGSSEDLSTSEDTDFALRVHQLGVQPHFCAEAEYSVRLRDNVRSAFRRGRNRGKSEVELYLLHRDAFDVRKDSLPTTIGRWLRLGLQAPQLLSDALRVVWSENFGRRIGRVQASFRERVWHP